MPTATAIRFYPEKWGQIDRFATLYHGTYQFPEHIVHCVSGTGSHFLRACTLLKLARSMVPSMAEDREELEKHGLSRNRRSSEVTAVVESAITALYSAIDSGRKVVTHIFRKYRGLPESTRKTFQAAKDGTIDERVPEKIRNAFRDADWYSAFRRIRDALTHVGTGSCHYDSVTQRVAYFHSALRDGEKALYVEDVFAEIDRYVSQTNQLLGQIFQALNDTLSDDEVFVVCGFHEGRVYSRYVRPREAVDFGAGRCDAYRWFELPENPRCPFTSQCAAYKRRKTGEPGATDNPDDAQPLREDH